MSLASRFKQCRLHRQSVGSPVREGGEEYGHILTISEHMVD